MGCCIMDNNAFYPSEVMSSGTVLENFSDKVFHWGVEKGLVGKNGVTSLSQIKKLKEEVEELEEALREDNFLAAELEAGDVLVVLLNICRLYGLDLTNCLEAAYYKISARKGKIVDGVFVKDV